MGWFTALVFLGVPGSVSGLATSRWGIGPGIGVATFLTALWVGASTWWWWVNPADVVVVGISAALGVFAVGGRAVVGTLLACLLFVGASEAAGRLVLPARDRPPARDGLWLRSTGGASDCWWHDPGGPPADVLHLGDSMITAWGGLPVDVPIPAVIDTLDATRRHVGAGVGGGGLGCAYGVLYTAPPTPWVVLHVFLGNDVRDLKFPAFWCGGRTRLDLSTTPPTPRCPEGPRAPDWVERWRFLPSPYVLRQAAHVSLVARWAMLRWHQFQALAQREHIQWAVADTHLPAALDLLRDLALRRGSRFAVVLLPVRESMQEVNPEVEVERHGDIVIDWATGHRTPVFDLRDRLAQAREAGIPDEALHTDMMRADPHYSPRAHRMLAAEIAPWLEAIIRGGPVD